MPQRSDPWVHHSGLQSGLRPANTTITDHELAKQAGFSPHRTAPGTPKKLKLYKGYPSSTGASPGESVLHGTKIIIATAAVLGLVGVAFAGERLPPFGGKIEGKRLERVEASEHCGWSRAEPHPDIAGHEPRDVRRHGPLSSRRAESDVPIPVERPSFWTTSRRPSP